MNYKDKLYSKYVSTHTSSIYEGEGPSKKNFYLYDSYFKRFLPKDKKGKVLDAGCGNGEFVWWLQKEGFIEAEGIDISAEQVELAKKFGIANIKAGDVKTLSGNYDLIFLRDVLEHFSKEEVLDVLEILQGRLNQKGSLVIQTVNAKNYLWGRLRHGDFTHDLAFTEESISQVLRVNGFKTINIYSQRPIIHGPISLIRYIFWMLLELNWRFYLIVETGSWRSVLTQNIIVKAEK